MLNRVREWGFPVGLLLVWAVAAAFTLSALVGMEKTLQATQAPQSTQIVQTPVAAASTKPAPHPDRAADGPHS